MFIKEFTFSVLICTYNASKFIEEQLESILNQKHMPDEIVISDDGSSDNTISIINLFFDNVGFTNYFIVSGPKKGACYNFLSGLKYITSDFLFISDQDDIWEDNKVEIFYSHFKKKNTPLLIYSDSSLINEKGDILHSSFFQYQNLSNSFFYDDSIFYNNCVQGATCCINRPLYRMAELSSSLPGSEFIVMHDWWFALLAKYSGEQCFIDQPLIRYRQHFNNEVGAISLTVRIKKVLFNPLDYYTRFLKNKKQKTFLINFVKSEKLLNSKLSYKNCGIIKRLLIWCIERNDT